MKTGILIIALWLVVIAFGFMLTPAPPPGMVYTFGHARDAMNHVTYGVVGDFIRDHESCAWPESECRKMQMNGFDQWVVTGIPIAERAEVFSKHGVDMPVAKSPLQQTLESIGACCLMLFSMGMFIEWWEKPVTGRKAFREGFVRHPMSGR